MTCFLLITCAVLNSCSKYLDAKSDQSIATPSSITDLEGILNNYAFINTRYPSASEVSSDNFFLVDADLAGLTDRQRNFYLRQKFADIGADYTSPYQSIAYVNIVLESLPKVSSPDLNRNQVVKGSALFVRASYHFALSQLFAHAFDNNTADADPGIALSLPQIRKPYRYAGRSGKLTVRSLPIFSLPRRYYPTCPF